MSESQYAYSYRRYASKEKNDSWKNMYRVFQNFAPLPRQIVNWLENIDNGILKYIQFKECLQSIMQYDCN